MINSERRDEGGFTIVNDHLSYVPTASCRLFQWKRSHFCLESLATKKYLEWGRRRRGGPECTRLTFLRQSLADSKDEYRLSLWVASVQVSRKSSRRWALATEKQSQEGRKATEEA